ncbi:hypothetical protein Poli38472_005952 [Pythium oligandrum]|uniref:Uncharacterized protein n=1 Tax=Pythium oligandrum TaxID=41045 RepID=A0A8K1CRZ0_PYTOL|nr:hypothetical protein Poli38472_005952 [Pythium oligandrum]|eukprot:TMW68484.1 hypothetical protein Poli38472_005952 [Pythium oligandrum]
MVRKASKLPASAKSVEEVMVERIASGAALDPRKSVADAARRRTTHFRAARKTTVAVGATVPISVASNAEPTENPVLGHLQSMDEEVSSLQSRLSSVAKSMNHTRQPLHTHQGLTNERSYHQQQIDKYIQDSMNEINAAYRGHTRRGMLTHEAGSTMDPAKGAQVNYAVREIRSTVRRLDRVFYEVATGDKQRHIAATKITALVRRFLVRRRYLRMRLALGQWRARKCALFLMYMEQFSAREEFLDTQIVRLQEERTQSWLRRIIAEIRDVALMNLPLRRRRVEETERRFLTKQRNWMKLVFATWKQCALGPRSRKTATADARARHIAARERLEALERFDVITAEMVHEEFLKENIRIVRSRHPFYLLKMTFNIILYEEYLPMEEKMMRANAHLRKKLLAKIWSVWLPLFRSVQVDKAIARVNERRTLDRFDKPFNLRKIDAHYRHTHLRKHLRAWFVYGRRVRRVRKLFEVNTKMNLVQLLQRWRIRARYQHNLRENAVEEWHAYSRRIYHTPFRAWYNYAAARRSNRQAKESICVAYQRRQRRHTKYAFFRLWKHQVLFGNIEGIHSKIHLLRSLEDQKRLCLGLEANARLYQEKIAALQHSIHELEGKVQEKQIDLLQLQDATQTTRFSIHSAEQNIARVQGMLEAVRQIHPHTIERIEKMFKENPLLTQDLKDVVALHVQKRREVMDKISLDATELEIQDATASDSNGGDRNSRRTLTREDQLLLHRVKWVLSRLDLQTYRSGMEPTRPPPGTHVPMDAMNQLCALFEFIRDGQTQALTRENDPSYPRGGTGNREIQVEDLPRVAKEDLLGHSETWHVFLQQLTVKFAQERMLLVQERLVKRAAEMNDELSEIKTNPHIYNMYSGSAQPPRPTNKD